MALSPDEYRSFKISKITTLTPNTKSFIVDLPTKDDETGLRPASYIMIKGPNNSRGKVLFAGYTSNDSKGFFELVIKTSLTSLVATHLHSLHVGEYIE
eukprot:gene40692-50347_t